jgi:hypothetical protein
MGKIECRPLLWRRWVRHHIVTLIHRRGSKRLLAWGFGGCPWPGLRGSCRNRGLVTVLCQPRLRCGARSLEAVESRSARDACRGITCFDTSPRNSSRFNDGCLGRWRRTPACPRCGVRGGGREAADGRCQTTTWCQITTTCAAGRGIVGLLLIRVGDLGHRGGWWILQGFGKESPGVVLFAAGGTDRALQGFRSCPAPLGKASLFLPGVHCRPSK